MHLFYCVCITCSFNARSLLSSPQPPHLPPLLPPQICFASFARSSSIESLRSLLAYMFVIARSDSIESFILPVTISVSTGILSGYIACVAFVVHVGTRRQHLFFCFLFSRIYRCCKRERAVAPVPLSIPAGSGPAAVTLRVQVAVAIKVKLDVPGKPASLAPPTVYR